MNLPFLELYRVYLLREKPWGRGWSIWLNVGALELLGTLSSSNREWKN